MVYINDEILAIRAWKGLKRDLSWWGVMKRLAHLLKQLSLITVYCLSTKEKQTSVFRFRLQETNRCWSCCFPLLLFSVCGILETWRHEHIDMEKWRHRGMEMDTWRHGDMGTRRHWDMETWKHKTENRRPGNFPSSVHRLLMVKTEVCRLPICWRRNK